MMKCRKSAPTHLGPSMHEHKGRMAFGDKTLPNNAVKATDLPVVVQSSHAAWHRVLQDFSDYA